MAARTGNSSRTAAASMTSIGRHRSSGSRALWRTARRLAASTIHGCGPPVTGPGSTGAGCGLLVCRVTAIGPRGRPDPAGEGPGTVRDGADRAGGDHAPVEASQLAGALGDGRVKAEREHCREQQGERPAHQAADRLAAVEGPPPGGPADADGAEQYGHDAEQAAEREQQERQHQREGGDAEGQRGHACPVPRGEPQQRRRRLAHGPPRRCWPKAAVASTGTIGAAAQRLERSAGQPATAHTRRRCARPPPPRYRRPMILTRATRTRHPRALSRVPSPALVLGAVASVQVGSALAKTLVDRAGPRGMVLLRLGVGAVVLLALTRPRLRGRSRRQLVLVVAFGAALAAMNSTFYSAIDRIPIGVAVTVEFAGPLAVAVAGARRLLDLVW